MQNELAYALRNATDKAEKIKLLETAILSDNGPMPFGTEEKLKEALNEAGYEWDNSQDFKGNLNQAIGELKTEEKQNIGENYKGIPVVNPPKEPEKQERAEDPNVKKANELIEEGAPIVKDAEGKQYVREYKADGSYRDYYVPNQTLDNPIKNLAEKIGANALDLAKGAIVGLDNSLGLGIGQEIYFQVTQRKVDGSETTAYYTGKVIGDGTAAIIGTVGVGKGLLEIGGGLALAPVTGGASSAISAAGVVTTVACGAIVKNSVENIEKDAGKLNASSGNGSEGSSKAGGKGIEITNPVLENSRTGSALKTDAQHAFNDIIDNYAGQAKKFPLKGGDGINRDLFQIEGSLNGKNGVFEWIIDPIEGVTHRRFIEGVGVTGKPNARK